MGCAGRTLSGDSRVACPAGCLSRVLLAVGTRRALPSAGAALAPLPRSWGCKEGPGGAAARASPGARVWGGTARSAESRAGCCPPPASLLPGALLDRQWDVGLPGAEVASRVHPPPQGAGSWGVPSDPQQSAGSGAAPGDGDALADGALADGALGDGALADALADALAAVWAQGQQPV